VILKFYNSEHIVHKYIVVYILYGVSIQTSTAYTWNCSLLHNCNIIIVILILIYFFIHFINSIFSAFQYKQCNTQTNVLGIYSFVLEFPEDGTMVLKHVGV
jgi:hypothetical protein